MDYDVAGGEREAPDIEHMCEHAARVPDAQDTRFALSDLLQSTTAWGRKCGTYVREVVRFRLRDCRIVFISLDDMKRMDVSFACSAFLELAKVERMRRGICLVDVSSMEIVDNLHAAALFYEQPLAHCCASGAHRFLGPRPAAGLRDMLAYVGQVGETTARDAADALGLRLPNASNKLKQLWYEGYLLRTECSMTSGGARHFYLRIGPHEV